MDCTPAFFRQWIQFQMYMAGSDSGMRLDNHGTVWQFDHVIPCKGYVDGRFDKEVVLTWKNLRPCPIRENSLKGSWIDGADCKTHLTTYKAFCIHHATPINTAYVSELEQLCETPRGSGIP